MKLMMLGIMILAAFSVLGQNAPVVSNMVAQQRSDGSKMIDIYYDLADGDADACEITLMLSSNNGASFDLIPSPANLSGDIGMDIMPGSARHIVWNAGAESYYMEGGSYRFKVLADDNTTNIAPNFVFVQGGTFFNGTSNMTISSFYIDKYELTQSAYQEIMGTNPASGYGVGPNFPVYMVSWFDAIEYCNRRSIAEELNPCYSYSSYGTNPDNWPASWDQSWLNQDLMYCNWSASGYRLPSEMEWMFAARGGVSSHEYTYSGSNDVDEVAWYGVNSGESSHPVGTKIANELGIYDMSGNLWESVWDRHGTYPTTDQNNYHGPSAGTGRVSRGGNYRGLSDYCAVGFRNWGGHATDRYNGQGFRICRNVPDGK